MRTKQHFSSNWHRIGEWEGRCKIFRQKYESFSKYNVNFVQVFGSFGWKRKCSLVGRSCISHWFRGKYLVLQGKGLVLPVESFSTPRGKVYYSQWKGLVLQGCTVEWRGLVLQPRRFRTVVDKVKRGLVLHKVKFSSVQRIKHFEQH